MHITIIIVTALGRSLWLLLRVDNVRESSERKSTKEDSIERRVQRVEECDVRWITEGTTQDSNGFGEQQLLIGEAATDDIPEVKDTQDGDPQDLSAKSKVNAELSFEAGGDVRWKMTCW